MPVESTFQMAGACCSRWGNGGVDASTAHWRTRGDSHSSYAIWEKASLPDFIAWFSFLLCRIASTAKRTNRDAKRGGLSHLAFLIDGDSTTGQKHIEALPQ